MRIVNLCLILLFPLLSMIACAPSGSFKITALPADQTVQEQVVYKAPWTVSDRVVLIDVSGVLMNGAMPRLLSEGENPVAFTVERLDAAAKDPRVKAVVFRVNSPGGSVTASDVLYQEVLEFKKKTKKPVIAYFQDVAASGAYYLACACDEIDAQRTCVTGSIGVIMQTVDLTGSMNKLGITADAIKSGPYKDAGSPLRPMKNEERAVFQGIVDGMYQQFLEVVQAGRPKLSREQITKLADGRVYTAQQALESGLIDRICTLSEALDTAKQRAGINEAQVVIYHRPQDWKPNIYAQGQGGPMGQTINLLNINMPGNWTKHPIFMYIWNAEG